MATQAQSYQHHPLPSPPEQAQLQYYQPSYQSDYQQQPQQQQPQQQQPPPPVHNYTRRNSQAKPQAKPRTFSFHSEKSHKSSGSKTGFHETSAEKESKRLHSKADPTLAISEAEPAVVAATMTQSSVPPLRSIQHKDPFGNAIADPDKSNPTRNRWERPLDTIRSFESAIDGSYSRKSMYRTDNESVANWHRRSSVQPVSQPRFRHESYYGGNRPVSYRPDNAYDSAGPSARNSYYDSQGLSGGYNNGGHGQPPPSRQRVQRMQSEPMYQLYGREQVYPMPHKDRSYETVTSAAASGNSDHAGYQTDPTSSDNSSIDRHSPAKRQEPLNDYGIGFTQSQNYSAPNFTVGVGNGAQHPLPAVPGGPAQQQVPRVPRKDMPAVLKRQATLQKPEASDKRKSWLARRFSRNG